MAAGFSDVGERLWLPGEVPAEAAPFQPLALRVKDRQGRVVDTLRSTEPITVEVEYRLSSPITGLRVGIYLLTLRGEYVFTSFDIDQPEQFEQYGVRQTGHYLSRCTIPGDFLNDGRYALALNASSFRVKRYFQDDHALAITVDGTGAPGKQWPEPRLGPVRPRLAWQIERVES
jgi:lipopolysaccharide transport system ATP-binding protein